MVLLVMAVLRSSNSHNGTLAASVHHLFVHQVGGRLPSSISDRMVASRVQQRRHHCRVARRHAVMQSGPSVGVLSVWLCSRLQQCLNNMLLVAHCGVVQRSPPFEVLNR
eukprot:CAMPEP_0196748874 /NCGR_PEP_ID=MMETSP1091-20130531/74896_1 /TAXON_ID=302021 /ORGANISM="Rhodomonas sp., Strain CCMP768" /LENGTH=108 /DNA_ID=CAMNT_0042096259 /DNA_START=40 /DNA_END=363 /DNA_ORIENTATION=+